MHWGGVTQYGVHLLMVNGIAHRPIGVARSNSRRDTDANRIRDTRFAEVTAGADADVGGGLGDVLLPDRPRRSLDQEGRGANRKIIGKSMVRSTYCC